MTKGFDPAKLKGYIHPDGWQIIDEPAFVDGEWRALVNFYGSLVLMALRLTITREEGGRHGSI